MTDESAGALEDPDYDRHGGFPKVRPTTATPGFSRFVGVMRQLQDLAVCADPDEDGWEDAAGRVEELVKLLDPFRAAERVGPAGRVPEMPGMGSLLLPPFQIVEYSPDGVAMAGAFSRYHVGGNMAVHGGVLPLLFDWMFGMVTHAAGRPISRTAYLHVDYRKVTPIDAPLTVRGRIDSVDGRKAFVSAELTDADGAVLAEANGLMVRLLPGQP